MKPMASARCTRVGTFRFLGKRMGGYLGNLWVNLGWVFFNSQTQMGTPRLGGQVISLECQPWIEINIQEYTLQIPLVVKNDNAEFPFGIYVYIYIHNAYIHMQNFFSLQIGVAQVIFFGVTDVAASRFLVAVYKL